LDKGETKIVGTFCYRFSIHLFIRGWISYYSYH